MTIEQPIVYLIYRPTDIPEECQLAADTSNSQSGLVLKTYKPVAKRTRPVPGVYPEDAQVIRSIPTDPLSTLPTLPYHPPLFTPTTKLTKERLSMIGVNKTGFLLPEEEQLFQHILKLNERCLAFEETDRGTFRDEYFSPYIIPIIPHEPWVYGNIPIPPGIKEKVLDLLREKIQAGVYERSQSSYRSRWFCVLKKSGKLRIVHDLQPLNAVTIRDAGIPPKLDDFIEPFAGRQCYTVFDLFWGFDARKMSPESRDLTSFSTPLGTLRITSMPMGFTNSPAEFQACMTFILKDEIPHVANVFIDDLPIKGPSSRYEDEDEQPERLTENPKIRRFIWEHAQDVHRIMHRVGEAGATFSAEKIQLCQESAIIVGQRCTPEGRIPDESKIDKIMNWPIPTNVKEVRGFLGLCGTVRIWIQDYSSITRPLRHLTRKETTFIWNDETQDAFDILKEKLTSPPALLPIDYDSDHPVVLAVDTSKYAIGIILFQEDDHGRKHPARYGSLPINATEANYSQAKLELYGLYRALRHYRLYLVGVKKLRIEVDAKYIKDMLNNPDLQPNATINRWIQGILMFDPHISHVPADKHQGPDALSRRPLAEGEEAEEHDDSWLDRIALYIGISPEHAATTMKKLPRPAPPSVISLFLHNNTPQDQTLRKINEFLTTLEIPPFPNVSARQRFLRKTAHYFRKDDELFRRYEDRMPVKVILDEEARLAILHEAHDQLGHRGELATFETIRLRFFWPFYYSDVKQYVRACRECQIRSIQRTEVPIHISTPVLVFQKVYLDIMHMPQAQGFRYIVAARDDLTGALAARALQRANAMSVAKFFYEEILTRFGNVLEVVTDNGSENKAAFERLLQRYDIPQIRISTYNSKANGVVERGHFILREALIKLCEGHPQRWPELLRQAVFADMITIRRSTGFSPYYLLYGQHPLLGFDLREMTFMVEGYRSNMPAAELLALRIRHLERRPEDIARAAAALQKTRLASKEQFERRFAHRMQKENFQPGELVLVRNNAIEQEHSRKHKPRYLGPYEIVRRTLGGAYVIKELNGNISRTGIAAHRLRLFHPNTDDLEALVSDPIELTGGREDTNNDIGDTQEGSQYQQRWQEQDENENSDEEDLYADEENDSA